MSIINVKGNWSQVGKLMGESFDTLKSQNSVSGVPRSSLTSIEMVRRKYGALLDNFVKLLLVVTHQCTESTQCQLALVLQHQQRDDSQNVSKLCARKDAPRGRKGISLPTERSASKSYQ